MFKCSECGQLVYGIIYSKHGTFCFECYDELKEELEENSLNKWINETNEGGQN